MKLIDSHAHLDLPEFDKDREEVIKRARKSGVEKIITIGIGIKENRKALEIARKHDFIYCSLGIHPHNAKHLDLQSLDFIEKNSTHDKVVAIGEMGLDFFRDLSPRDTQRRCFRTQLDIAISLKLPVIIHDRDAHDEITEIMREEKAWQAGGVVHCFSGDYDMAVKCVDMGFFISIPGTITYKKAETLKDVVKKIPIEHILIETDCPFLSPVPFRGKRNEPAYIKYAAEKIAEIKKISAEQVAAATSENTVKLFKIQ